RGGEHGNPSTGTGSRDLQGGVRPQHHAGVPRRPDRARLRVSVPWPHSVTATGSKVYEKESPMKTPTAGLMNGLRVAALAGCLQLAAVYPLAQAPAGGAQQPTPPAAQQPGAPAGQAPGRGRGPQPV